jgi:hypothetical protein
MPGAPDYVEPVEAWRVWVVAQTTQGARLRSVFHDAVWRPDEPLSARCEHRRLSLRAPWRARTGTHPAPSESCRCGIYAALRPADVMAYFSLRGPGEACRAIGRVALWGEVVECESGYRAQHAYPTHLYVPAFRRSRWPGRRADVEDVLFGLAAYGVPVEIVAAADAAAILPLLRAA